MMRVLMLEFNELSPVLMDDFIAAGHLPAFARLRDDSATFITDAGEVDERLNPWVQWVTVHTGATAAEHGIAKLGEAHKLVLPTIADVVSDAGQVVWLCGSMNVQPCGNVRGAVLPDPWSVHGSPQPESLEPFFRFVSANVQEHTSTTTRLSKREAIAFVRFMMTHGLSPSTAVATLGQLAGERVHRVPRERRAELLDRFQWDAFASLHRRLRPAFATFFSNSTAHFQHVHWDELEQAPSESAVLHGYKSMDRLVDKAIRLAGDDVTVVLCTGLSQTANDTDDGYDGFYRPRDLEAWLRAMGVHGVRDATPMMAEQAHVFFVDAESAAAGEARLSDARCGGDLAFNVRRSGDDVIVGCRFRARRSQGRTIELSDGRSLSFDDHFYWTDAPREGEHHPDGMFWIRNGDNTAHNERVPLTTVAPTVLALLGVEPPASMTCAALSAARSG